RFRALKLWMVLRHYGAAGLQHHVRSHVAWAQEVAGWVEDDPRFELVVPAPLNLVCFRHRGGDEVNERLLGALNASGRVFLSHTRVDGLLALRLSIGQTATERRHVVAVWQLIDELAPACTMTAPGLEGRLLVATPRIADPNFERTVVLVLAHGAEGVLGVVLNRPSEVAAAELVPGWGERAATPGVLFIGGPVGPNTVIGLHRDGAVDLSTTPQETTEAPTEVRLFAGSAGWGADQLRLELEELAWWVLDAEPEDRCTRDPGTLWRRVLRRQAGPTAWFATFPDDLTTN
ncbi:MAG: YqgE/AlgH family protein, partial [Acidimicrobiales bacterium]